MKNYKSRFQSNQGFESRWVSVERICYVKSIIDFCKFFFTRA